MFGEKSVANNQVSGYHKQNCIDYIKKTFTGKEGASMVSLTDGAVQKFKETVEKQGKNGDGVRIFVIPGG